MGAPPISVRISTPLGVTPDPILKALISISYPEKEKISDIGKNKAF
jgi:hypothetical protein